MGKHPGLEGALIALAAAGDLEGARELVSGLDLETCQELLVDSLEATHMAMTTPGLADLVVGLYAHPEAAVEIGRKIALEET